MILVNLPCHEEGNRYRMLKILCLVMVLLNDVTESVTFFIPVFLILSHFSKFSLCNFWRASSYGNNFPRGNFRKGSFPDPDSKLISICQLY